MHEFYDQGTHATRVSFLFFGTLGLMDVGTLLKIKYLTERQRSTDRDPCRRHWIEEISLYGHGRAASTWAIYGLFPPSSPTGWGRSAYRCKPKTTSCTQNIWHEGLAGGTRRTTSGYLGGTPRTCSLASATSFTRGEREPQDLCCGTAPGSTGDDNNPLRSRENVFTDN